MPKNVSNKYRKIVDQSPNQDLPMVADDYGISEQVNQAIISSVLAKEVSIVSILPNFVSAKDIRLLKKHLNTNSMSAHINLVRGKPISSQDLIPSLVGKNGNFYPIYIFLPLLYLGRIKKEDIVTEIKAQLTYLQTLGVNFSYIDSEQHTHLLEPVKQSLLELIPQMKIAVKMRSTWSSFNYLKRKPLRYHILKLFLMLINRGSTDDPNYTYDAFLMHPGTTYDG